MGLIQHLAEIYEQSRIEYEQQKSGAFRLIERLEAGNGEKEERGVGMLAYGDNAACMRWLLSEKELTERYSSFIWIRRFSARRIMRQSRKSR